MEGEVITQVCTSGGENLGHCFRTLPATLSSFRKSAWRTSYVPDIGEGPGDKEEDRMT